VYDISPRGVQEVVAKGGKSADSPKGVASQVDVVLTSVPGPPEVEAAYLGENGIIEGARQGATLIDLTTVDPATSQKVGQVAAQRGLKFLDAPVSGGTTGAAAGTLTIMVGGDAAVFEESLPILQCIGKNITHTGGTGAGSVVKLLNQMMVGITTAAVSEMMVLGTKWGVNPQIIYDVLSTGYAGSTIMSRHIPNFVLKRDFEAGFTVNLLSKDVWLALTLGRDQTVPLEMTAVASQVLERAKAHGLGDKDMSSVIVLLEKLTGVEVRPK
jgi:3-hydroxyisobutyrate dehydrogenase-like beta-hydroxyacid dehydrogenase